MAMLVFVPGFPQLMTMIPDDDDYFSEPNWAMVEVGECQVVPLEVLTMKSSPLGRKSS
jgi:hypothetical protein